MIPRYPRKTTAGIVYASLTDLTPGSTLTKRTVERDLHELAGIFPITHDGCKPQGWSWGKDAGLFTIPNMDLTTAITLRMAQEYLSRLLPRNCFASLTPHLHRAQEILNKQGTAGLAEWPEKIKIVPRIQPLVPPVIEPQVLDLLYDALLENRQFKGIYKAQGKPAKEYELNPLGVVFNDPIAYLVATRCGYNELRLFALHRFSSVELLDTRSICPDNFSLQEYIDGGAFGFINKPRHKITLKAHFTFELSNFLRESPLSNNQRITDNPDGSAIVEAEVSDNHQLRLWLLGFGSDVEVLAPASLRREIALHVVKMGKLYAEEFCLTEGVQL